MVAVDGHAEIGSGHHFVHAERGFPCLRGPAVAAVEGAEEVRRAPVASLQRAAVSVAFHLGQAQRTGVETDVAHCSCTPKVYLHARTYDAVYALPRREVGRHPYGCAVERLCREIIDGPRHADDEAVCPRGGSQVETEGGLAVGTHVLDSLRNEEARGRIAVEKVAIPDFAVDEDGLLKEGFACGGHLRDLCLARTLQRTHLHGIVVCRKGGGIIEAGGVGRHVGGLQFGHTAMPFLAERRAREGEAYALSGDQGAHLATVHLG